MNNDTPISIVASGKVLGAVLQNLR